MRARRINTVFEAWASSDPWDTNISIGFFDCRDKARRALSNFLGEVELDSMTLESFEPNSVYGCYGVTAHIINEVLAGPDRGQKYDQYPRNTNIEPPRTVAHRDKPC